MAGDNAARRYAQAVFEIAREGGTIAAWRNELADLATALGNEQFAAWLSDERIALEERSAAVGRVLDVSPLALNLAKLLVSRGRAGDAPAVAEAFNRLADAHDGIEDAMITTAVPLSAEQQERITQQLSGSLGKKIRMTAAVDPSLLGGVIVRVGDRLVDGSVKTRLRLLRKELEGAV